MFTEADHAKAVELAQILPQPDWWPDELHATFNGEGEFKRWILYATEVPAFFALSAIAWAMEDALGSRGDFSVGNTESGEWVVTLQTNYGRPPMETRNASRFLALAAAIEDQK